MILNNTQANIFKVNGGIADNFANRPAASGSFYIFYSIDTQEIYYDNGSWVLIGSAGGGTPVNIYNSNGTLTGNRTLDGNNNLLAFNNVSSFSVNMSDSGSIRKSNFPILCGIDFSNSIQYFTRIYYRDFNNPNDTDFYLYNSLIKTLYNNNDIGLKLDFANNTYVLGDEPNGRNILYNANVGAFFVAYNGSSVIDANAQNFNIAIGDANNAANQTNLIVLDTNQIIKTSNQGNDIGLKLDFAHDEYEFGGSIANNTLQYGLKVDGLNLNIKLGDYNDQIGAGVILEIDYNSATISTHLVNTSSNGFNLNLINKQYQFGQITGGNTTYLNINDITQQFSVINQSQSKGLYLDFQSNRYFYGDYFGLNAAYIEVDASQQRIITKGTTPGQSRGLDLLPNSSQYYFGNSTDLNRTFIQINDFVENIFTSNKGVTKGISLNFATNNYQFGQITGGNITKFIISDAGREIYTSINNSVNGLLISQSNDNYKFGVFNGGNVTNITITDGAVYPIRLNGNNLSSGTASGSSGQHLKININGTPYKIALLNP